MIWHIIDLSVFAVLVVIGLSLYHTRGVRRILHEQHLADGWTRKRTPMGEVLICPRCRAPVFSWPEVDKHMGETSPCGLLMRADYELDTRPEAGYVAEEVGRERSNALGIEGERTSDHRELT